jgi:hypothetical protein
MSLATWPLSTSFLSSQTIHWLAPATKRMIWDSYIHSTTLFCQSASDRLARAAPRCGVLSLGEPNSNERPQQSEVPRQARLERVIDERSVGTQVVHLFVVGKGPKEQYRRPSISCNERLEVRLKVVTCIDEEKVTHCGKRNVHAAVPGPEEIVWYQGQHYKPENSQQQTQDPPPGICRRQSLPGVLARGQRPIEKPC